MQAIEASCMEKQTCKSAVGKQTNMEADSIQRGQAFIRAPMGIY